MPKRYDADLVDDDPFGEFVSFDDYELLEQQRDELLAALKEAVRLIEVPVESFESGSCMCGSAMKGHPPAIMCGHEAFDSGLYYESESLRKIHDTIAKAERKIE